MTIGIRYTVAKSIQRPTFGDQFVSICWSFLPSGGCQINIRQVQILRLGEYIVNLHDMAIVPAFFSHTASKSPWRCMTRIAGAAILALGIARSASVVGQVPPTEKQEVVDEYHGSRVEDPYRWLEGGALIEDPAEADALEQKVAAWTDRQNDYTRAVLDGLPGREALFARMEELMTVESIGTPQMHGRYYFYSRQQGDENQAVLYVREGLDGEPRVLLDPNTLDEAGLTSLDWTAPNHDGTLMAFGLSHAGNEISTLYVMDVKTGAWLADEIPSNAQSVYWMPDSSGFLYEWRRDVDDPYSVQIRYHTVGQHYRQDPVLFEQFDKTWGPAAWLSRDGRWMILMYWTGTDSNDLWVIDFDRWRRTGEFVRETIVAGEKATFTPSAISGDSMYMHTTLGASNGCVYRVDLNKPGRDHWTLLIPELPDAVLSTVSAARGLLIASYDYKAHTMIDRFDFDGNHLGELDMPGIGSAWISTSVDRTEAFLNYSSFNEPPTIYHIELAENTRELWARPEVPIDPSIVEVSQVTYESKDGTPVTMFVVHKKGLELDGNNPTILSGYGGFNISMTPWFSKTMFPWYEAGGVMAVPNLRGGGEYGHAWHQAGMLENKQNVFDDFIAAAEWLIANGYTNPSKLAISGGSNGGLLVGAVAMQRPDLFKAVVCAVPLLDMLRYQHFLMARYWVPEYGSSEDPEQFQFLIKYSPYQNIKPGITYPSIFFTAGENDARVHPCHARKMAAALQNLDTANQDERPILLWVDREAGHGGGKPMRNIIRDIVDSRIYIMWQLGMLPDLN